MYVYILMVRVIKSMDYSPAVLALIRVECSWRGLARALQKEQSESKSRSRGPPFAASYPFAFIFIL